MQMATVTATSSKVAVTAKAPSPPSPPQPTADARRLLAFVAWLYALAGVTAVGDGCAPHLVTAIVPPVLVLAGLGLVPGAKWTARPDVVLSTVVVMYLFLASTVLVIYPKEMWHVDDAWRGVVALMYDHAHTETFPFTCPGLDLRGDVLAGWTGAVSSIFLLALLALLMPFVVVIAFIVTSACYAVGVFVLVVTCAPSAVGESLFG